MKVHCRRHWRAASTPIVSRGLAKEGESRRADKGGLGGPGNFTRNIQEGIQRRYLEGGGGGALGHVGKRDFAGTTDGSRIVHVTK